MDSRFRHCGQLVNNIGGIQTEFLIQEKFTGQIPFLRQFPPWTNEQIAQRYAETVVTRLNGQPSMVGTVRDLALALYKRIDALSVRWEDQPTVGALIGIFLMAEDPWGWRIMQRTQLHEGNDFSA